MNQISIPEANELEYSKDELSDAQDFLFDEGILITPETLAAAALLVRERY